jgi:hypothetical protein
MFNDLPTDEEHSKLFVYPKDNANKPVFSFRVGAGALHRPDRCHRRARVLPPLPGPDSERSLRLSTSGQYRRATSNPDGQPIPLADIQGNEYVTIPCFALPRIDMTIHKMDEQRRTTGTTTQDRSATLAVGVRGDQRSGAACAARSGRLEAVRDDCESRTPPWTTGLSRTTLEDSAHASQPLQGARRTSPCGQLAWRASQSSSASRLVVATQIEVSAAP